MVLTDEEKLQNKRNYQKEYRNQNKEKIAKYKKDWKENNKENLTEYGKLYREKNKERIKEYNKTAPRKKSKRLNDWKRRGLLHDNIDELYEQYINTNECNVCKVEFTDKNKRCMDHDHQNGAFRNILCNRCNVNDNWKKLV